MGYTHANYLRLGVTAPKPPRSKSHGKQASSLQAGARSNRRGLGVGVVDSFGRSFVWGVFGKTNKKVRRKNPRKVKVISILVDIHNPNVMIFGSIGNL